MRLTLSELGLAIDVPEGSTAEESVYGDWALIETPTFSFAIQAFIPEGSAFTVEEARGRISRDVRITHEESTENTWRFDTEAPDGTLGTHMRIREPRTLDVGISECTPAQRDAFLAAIATLRWS